MQTIAAGGEVDSMLLSGKMLIVGLHVSPEEGMVRAWNIDSGADVVLPGRHRVSHPCCPILFFVMPSSHQFKVFCLHGYNLFLHGSLSCSDHTSTVHYHSMHTYITSSCMLSGR